MQSNRNTRWWLKHVKETCPANAFGCWIYPHPGADGTGFCRKKGRVFFNWQRRRGKRGRSSKKEYPATTILARAYKMRIPKKWVASHRCHEADCLNPRHVVFEHQGINANRTRCKAATCTHKSKCLRDGSLAHQDPLVLEFQGDGYHAV